MAPIFACSVAAMLAVSAANAETQLFDGFDGHAIDSTLWQYPTGIAAGNGRTRMRPVLPAVSGGLLHLRLDTYNPAGRSFLGSEVLTKHKLAPGKGLSLEVRARLVDPVKGLVAGLFLYDFFLPTRLHSEIDFELLTNRLPDRVQTNIYNNEPLGDGRSAFHAVPGLDTTRFNTYRIEWRNDRVRWLVNHVPVREDLERIPREPLAIHLNYYVPSCKWAIACDPGLLPAERPEDNRTYRLEIDYVHAIVDSSSIGRAASVSAGDFGPASPFRVEVRRDPFRLGSLR